MDGKARNREIRGEEYVKYTVSLKENRQFRRLYAKGKSEVSPYLALYWRKNGGKENRLGITVGGKLGKAVKRNLVRRRLREAYRTNEGRFASGYDLVVVARVRAAHSSYRELEQSLLSLARRAKLLRPEEREEKPGLLQRGEGFK